MNIRERLFERSAFAKLRPETSQEIIDIARDLDWSDGSTPETMTKRVSERYKQKYGSGLVINVILQLIVPVVVEIFMEWWKNRDQE